MKNETHTLFRGLIGFFLLTAADQATKYAAATCLKERGNVRLIPGIFEFYYLENKGAAFGILNGRQSVFAVIALLVLLYLLLIYRKIPAQSRYTPVRLSCILVASGSLGNVIDRLTHNYVIDFLYFSLIDFPVFNLADCYVSIGIFLMVLLMFTYYKEDSFDFLNPF